MFIHTGTVATLAHWTKRKDRILHGMRLQIENTAHRRDLDLGHEIVEVQHMTQDPDGTWRSAHPENATHVKVTIEREAV